MEPAVDVAIAFEDDSGADVPRAALFSAATALCGRAECSSCVCFVGWSNTCDVIRFLNR